jgi:hypothetical protein
MSFAHWLIVAALASVPFAAVAQQIQNHAGPSDANAPIPASTYESAFKNYKPAADEQEPPDKRWRAANDEVRKLGGHAGHVEDNSTAPSARTPAPAMPAHHDKHH